MIFRFILLICALAILGCATKRDYYLIYEAAQKSGICNIHDAQMYKENVEIAYGLIMVPPGGPSPDTVATQFPYAEHFVFGGCVMDKDSPDRRDLYICPMCEKAQKEWVERDKIRNKLQLVPNRA